jgi:formylglycine-generating enzyme required for sulfatase activity
MQLIPSGTFLMGSADEEQDAVSEKPQHPVTITQRFALGRYPVTFEEYDRFAASSGRERPNDQGWGRGRRPVINVSWDDAVAYCAWLSQQTGRSYRLPTEAEWEYACRAGSKTHWCFGDEEKDLGEHAWYRKNAESKTHPVGEKQPNPWGLYDMHGNVWEWCLDSQRAYTAAAATDPVGPTDAGASRVLRGGSWRYFARNVRSACRSANDPGDRGNSLGFRCARVQS